MIISNSFFVQVIEDGSALRGEIRATAPLSQAYNDGKCVPDWSSGTRNPTVYIILQNGGRYELPDDSYTWFYNEEKIEFDSNGRSNYMPNNKLAAGTFERVTNFTPEMYQSGQYVPAMKIAKNVASSENVDIDVIRFSGQKTINTNPVKFVATIDVSITELMKGGYIGMIYLNGSTDKDISSKTDTVKLIAHLYDSNGEEVSAQKGARYRWLINDTERVAKGTTNTLTVTESDIYDYGIVRCEFYFPIDDGTGAKPDTLVSTDFLEIDDTQDPQEMYFAYNGAYGKSASLRAGEHVEFTIWVGDAGNPSLDNVDSRFSQWKVMLVDSNKQTLMQRLSSYDASIKDADASGYRQMNVSSGKATINIPFAVAALTAGGQPDSGGIRGYVQAQTNS